MTAAMQKIPDGEEDVINDSKNVKDKYNLAFILFYLLGTFVAIPRDFFITANDYWMYKFRDISGNENRTQLQTEFFSTFNTVATVTTMLFIGSAVFVAKLISIEKRLLGSMGMMLTFFIINLIFVKMDTDSWQQGFYVLSMIIGAVLNGFAAFCNVPVFQLTSKFPPKCLGAQLSGQSICGIFAAVIQIFSLAVGTSSEIKAFLYFFVGTLGILITIIYYWAIATNSKYFKTHNTEDQPSEEKLSGAKIVDIFQRIKISLLTFIILHGATVIMHPGMTSLIVSVNKGNSWSDTFFVPVSVYLFYNLFDLLGREAGRMINVHESLNPWILLGASIIRGLLFVPLLMLCNIQPRNNLPVILDEDYDFMVLIILFASTGGFFSNICVLRIPTLIDKDEMKLAFVILLLFIVITLASFSFLGIYLIKVL